MASINLQEFRVRESAGLVTARPHPIEPLLIWNYTPRCQYSAAWDDVTMQARGLITTLDGEVRARPFRKFFNYGEQGGKGPLEPFEVYEKLDGCLAITYWINGRPYLATRGSFTSEQAARADEVFYRYGYDLYLKEGLTYLFEFISPKFRIVVDYGDREDLYLLAIFDPMTGAELPIPDQDLLPFPVAERYDFRSFDEILAQQNDTDEGFVVRFQSGFRCKVKTAEYCRLHKILTQCSSKSIWESLRDGKPLDEILERVPDEFMVWVKNTKRELEARYANLDAAAKLLFLNRPKTDSRREVAEYFKASDFPAPGVLFNMLDGKDYSGQIWKLLRPKFEKPFREDEG